MSTILAGPPAVFPAQRSGPGARARGHVARVHSGLRRGGPMAIVVLVLWLFTAGAGFYLLVTSNLGRARPAANAPVATAPAATAPATTASPATASPATA